MLTTTNLVEWIRERADTSLGVVEADYATECIQKLREYDEVRDALMKIVEGFEELERIYLEKE